MVCAEAIEALPERRVPERVSGRTLGPAARIGRDGVLGYVVGAVALALSLAALWLLWQVSRPIGLLLAAIVLANALEPVADALTRRMRRTFAITTIYLALFGVIALAGALFVPHVMDQANALAADGPRLLEEGRRFLASLGPIASSVGSSAAQSTGGGGGAVAALPLTVASSALEVVLVVFLSMYWLVAMPTLRAFFLSFVPPDRDQEARSVLREIGETMGGYVRGVLIEAALIGVVVYAGLSLIGVRYAAVLAVLAGLGEFVPYVGPIVAAVPAVLLALLESPTLASVVIGFYLVLQIVEGYVLFPLVVGSQSEIPPLLIIVGLLAGGAVGGVLGALVAVPVAGALRVAVLRVVVPRIRRRLAGTTALPEPSSGDE
jgi:predicted PurR-regulated permease PerM